MRNVFPYKLNIIDTEVVESSWIVPSVSSVRSTSKSSSVVISEKATDGNLPSEDWAANIEICDIINETEEG